jgi:hypothetical protein
MPLESIPGLPDGQISELPVQPPLQKYSASRLPQIKSRTSAVPSSCRGVGHRHERWDGMRWTRQRQARKGSAGRDEPRERSNGAQDE